MFPSSQATTKTLWILGDFYSVKISGSETGGRYSIWEIDVAPNNGPPMHRHSREDEAFYVLEGEFSFPYGNSKIKAGKGEFAYVPRGEFHTYKNVGSSAGKLLVVITPPEFEKFFEEIGIPIEKGERFSFTPPKITPADIEKVVKAAEKYGLEIRI
jgi:quercetin dioxygenase-like cupin family protein